MKYLFASCFLFLASCAAVPQEPSPSAAILVGNCTDAMFLVIVDTKGGLYLKGGDTKPSSTDETMIHRAEAMPDLRVVELRVGDCQDL